jgi:hypothetical protein
VIEHIQAGLREALTKEAGPIRWIRSQAKDIAEAWPVIKGEAKGAIREFPYRHPRKHRAGKKVLEIGATGAVAGLTAGAVMRKKSEVVLRPKAKQPGSAIGAIAGGLGGLSMGIRAGGSGPGKLLGGVAGFTVGTIGGGTIGGEIQKAMAKKGGLSSFVQKGVSTARGVAEAGKSKVRRSLLKEYMRAPEGKKYLAMAIGAGAAGGAGGVGISRAIRSRLDKKKK